MIELRREELDEEEKVQSYVKYLFSAAGGIPGA